MEGENHEPILVRLPDAKQHVLPCIHHVPSSMIHELQTALIVRLRKFVDLCEPSCMRLKWGGLHAGYALRTGEMNGRLRERR